MRRLLVLVAVSSLAVGPAVAATTASAEHRPYDADGATLNILPPGSNGNVTAADLVTLGAGNLPNLFSSPDDPQGALATATPDSPPHFADQLEMYDALNTVAPYSLADGDLTKYYKDAAIDPPATPASTETPRDGVVIARDGAGVPHITGRTAEDVAYGAGYAGIEDRMFLTDILRHTGAAQMASFLGPSDADIAMDQSQLQLAPYTPKEAEAQITKAVRRYGAEGRALLARVDAFIAGMNAAQESLCPLAFDGSSLGSDPGDNGVALGPDCPVEYAALQKAPRPYTRADIVYIASLVGGIFGKGGGNEYQDALFFQALRSKFGSTRARSVYNDLREKNDPEAFSSASTPFP